MKKPVPEGFTGLYSDRLFSFGFISDSMQFTDIISNMLEFYSVTSLKLRR